MGLKTVPMFTIVCDFCGADFNEDGEYSAWYSKHIAWEVFFDSYLGTGWSTFLGGTQHVGCPEHPLCRRCGVLTDPLYGERDYLCRRCWTEEGGDNDMADQPGTPKPPGLGRSRARHSKEANAAMDAWKTAVDEDLANIEQRLANAGIPEIGDEQGTTNTTPV